MLIASSGRNAACFLTILVVSAYSALAAPSLFIEEVATTCTSHPDEALGRHGAPLVDPGISFLVTRDGIPAASVCGGSTYQVTIQFSNPSMWLLTSSAGNLSVPGTAHAPQCPNRAYSNVPVKRINGSLALPCGVSGEVALTVTSAASIDGRFYQNSIHLDVGAACTTTSCTDGNNTNLAAAKPTLPLNVSTVNSEPSPPALPLGLQPAYSGCSSSRLGYACARSLGVVTLHYTIGGSSPPPNHCTGPGNTSDWQGSGAGSDWGLSIADNTSSPASATATSETRVPLVHWALEAPVQGYIGLGWAEKSGQMVPMDAVIGGVGRAGHAYLNTHHFSWYGTVGAAANPLHRSWALAGGAARMHAGTTTAICFSTAAAVPGTGTAGGGGSSGGAGGAGRQGKRLVTQGVVDMTGDMAMNWAAHATHRLGDVHDHYGSFILNLQTGALRVVAPPLNRLIIAHGILMSLAFALLLPTGILLMRYRCLYGSRQVFGKAIWFWAHIACQVLGLGCFIVGVALALARFNINHFPSTDKLLGKSHYGLGVLLIPMLGLQVISGIFFRPAPTHTLRSLWNYAHNNWGLIIVPWGLVNVYLGALLYTKKWVSPDDQSSILLRWVVPTSVVPGVLLVAEVVLQSLVRVRSARTVEQQPKVEIIGTCQEQKQQEEEQEVSPAGPGGTEPCLDPQQLEDLGKRPSLAAVTIAVTPAHDCQP